MTCDSVDPGQRGFPYHAMRPKSGGFLESLRWTQPPIPPPPAPPCALAPPAPPSPVPLGRRRFGWGEMAPPEPRVIPPGAAKARAWLTRSWSYLACSARTSLRICENNRFSLKLPGPGGMVEVTPMAMLGSGGVVSRKVKRCVIGLEGLGNTF